MPSGRDLIGLANACANAEYASVTAVRRQLHKEWCNELFCIRIT